MPLLSLRLGGKEGDCIRILGFAEMDGKFACEPVEGRLGDQFPLETECHRVRGAWQLRITGDTPLVPGYSGSPVIRADTMEVLAVTTHEKYKGERGYAIDIVHLRDLYRHSLPEDLLQDDTLLLGGLRIELKNLIQPMGVTASQMRLFCHLALPMGSTYTVPMQVSKSATSV